jgi:hypothetical protein
VEYVHCENSNAAAITAYALKKNENVLTVTIHCGMAEQQIK